MQHKLYAIAILNIYSHKNYVDPTALCSQVSKPVDNNSKSKMYTYI